jgi:hypothetical protein
VKQSELGEYEENARVKQNIQYTRQSTNPPSNQGKSQALAQTKPYGWQTSSSELKRVVTKTRGFSMQKTIIPLNQGKSNQAQIRSKTPTPPEDKYRPLKQQGKSKHI